MKRNRVAHVRPLIVDGTLRVTFSLTADMAERLKGLPERLASRKAA